MISKAALRRAMLLYGVTDRAWTGQGGTSPTLAEQVEAALQGGTTCIQLREKHLDSAEFLEEAFVIGEICKRHGVPFIINDNVGIALAVGADGVHVGQDDMPCAEVRQIVGPEVLIGVSVHTVAEAEAAKAAGADYLGVGTVFPTSSKDDAEAVSLAELQAICAATDLPVVAIGGINAATVEKLTGSGIDGIACISAIFAASHIKEACEQLKEQAQAVVTSGPCKVKAAVFDFDGTLFDSMPAWENAGPRFLEQHNKEARPELWEKFRTLTLDEAAQLVKQEYEIDLTIEEIAAGINKTVEDAYSNDILPKPGAIDFVQALHARGVRTVIATASDRYLIEAALNRCGIAHLFEDIFTCGALNTDKRHPYIYQRAMESIEGTYQNTVVFEDSIHALETAKNDGFYTCAIADTAEARQEVLAELADCHLTTFEEPEEFWALARRM